MHLSVALEKYLLQLAADGRSGLTKAQYARHVRLLARWLESQGHTGEIEAIDQETLARFLSSPVARTRPDGTAKKATSMNVLRSTVRTFFAYAHRAGYIAHDPARLVRRAICEAPPARALGALAAAGEIDEREAHVTLLRAAEDCGLPRGEADRTIQNGWRAGMKQPRVPPGFGDLNMTFRKPPPPVEEATYDAAPWPAPMNGAAHIGLTGDFVGLVAPHSEADPAALLIQFLVTFGNVIGRGPYFVTEADRQTGNLFAVLVGTTSKGRKGTSWGYVKSVFGAVDPVWSDKCHLSGLASGEGLIWAVRDPIERKEPIKQRGRITDYQTVVADHGAADKRALFCEGELSSVLRVLARGGNTLSAMVRCAWDTGDLQTATKNSPAKATGAHISIVGHATKIELMRDLSQTESANGFGNRFLWICTRRSKLLPDGGAVPGAQLLALAKRLEDLLPFAREERRLRRDEEAKELWHRVYPELSEGKPGLMGAMVARAEAQVTRLSLLYALLDQSSVIRAPHLRAALEVWRYSEASARFVFGNALGTRWPTRSSEP